MSDKTPGGLLLPDDDALELVEFAPWPPSNVEPSEKPGGLRVEAGYLSPYFVTDPERFTAELDDALVLIAERPIERARELVPILEEAARKGRAVLVVAPGLAGEVLALLALNKLRGTLRVCAIASKDLEPIARHLGCEVLRAPLEGRALADLGAAKRVTCGMKSTIIERAA
ncbi:MAG: hypothetical protein PHS14_02500 [Elusimicrobia bacterium]|nr:hypothetical protein [Elusimicrobiota bacterium]